MCDRECHYAPCGSPAGVSLSDRSIASIAAGYHKRAVQKLEYIDLATRVEDLRALLGNRLHTLEGDRKGQYSISVNDQWRVCFHFIDGDAFEVEITDYH